jgi:glyoxylase-like metal-dependent hydrolase (beta-lactamase superfamily II)
LRILSTEHSSRLKEVEFIWARNSKEFLFSNSILIHGERPVIVDPSANFTYIEQIAQTHTVKTVLNTHYHGDHRSLNQLFRGEVVFASHEADAKPISDHAEYARVSDKDPNSYYSQWTLDVFKKYKIVECPVSLRFKDGDVIDTGAEKIRIVHAPGHTPGHSALYFENANLLYVADIDLTPYGPWYANVVSDMDAFKNSIRNLRDFECEHYVPSHGERIYDRATFLEKLDRYERHFSDRDEKILNLVKAGPIDMATLCSHGIVYRQIALSDPLKAYFQFQMVEKHVEALLQKGLLAKNGETLVFTG